MGDTMIGPACTSGWATFSQMWGEQASPWMRSTRLIAEGDPHRVAEGARDMAERWRMERPITT